MRLPQFFLGALLIVAPAVALGQTGGGVSLSGPSTGGSLVTPATINAAVNTALGLKADATSPTISGTQVNLGPIHLSFSSPSLITTYASGGLVNDIIQMGGGAYIEYCPVLSCVTSPTSGHQRAQAVFWNNTSFDGEAEEQNVAIETIVDTGYYTTWTTSHAYALGANVHGSGGANTIYRATTAGTSASSGAGPTGTGSGIVDGTVRWAWINAAAIDSKVGLYNEEDAQPGAGNSWVQANNVTLEPSVVPSFNINTELDFTNNAATCSLGVANCNSLEMNMGGTYQSTTAVHIGSTNPGATFATNWGVRLNGNYLASAADIEDDAGAAIGLGFLASGIGSASHSTATIEDATTSPVSLLITASHATADINDTATGPAALNITGTHTLADVRIATASAVALSISGAHTSEEIADSGTGPAALNITGTHTLADVVIGTSSAVGISLSGAHSGEDINDSGSGPAGVSISGTHTLAALYLAGDTAPTAIAVASGKTICLNGTAVCFKYDGTTTHHDGPVSVVGYMQTSVATVSTISSVFGACSSGLKGAIGAVSDATAPTFLGTLTGGGAVVTPIFCNGTAWVAG